MNHDVAARGYSELAGAFAVLRIRIGNMDLPIKLAMLIPAIENISAFWGPVIAFTCLCADRVAAEGHLVDLDDLTVIQKGERARALCDDNFVGTRIRRQTIFGRPGDGNEQAY
jgi:hypothetical protein